MKIKGCPHDHMQLGNYCIPKYCKMFIDHYGRSLTMTHRGYLLPDGSAIDFSKMSHTEIAKPNKKPRDYGIMSSFMKACKAIRFSLGKISDKNILVVESYNKPTLEQTYKFVKLMPKADKFYGERTGNNQPWPCSFELNNPTPLDFQKFVSRCW